LLVHGRAVPPEELTARVDAVGAADVAAIAARCAAAPPTLVVLGP